MNTVLHRKSPSTGCRRPDSARGAELSEKHSLAILCFFVPTGLLSVVADVFTNTVPMPNQRVVRVLERWSVGSLPTRLITSISRSPTSTL